MNKPNWFMECPCCGDDAAWGNKGDLVSDGQPLACGCKGWISVSAEDEPYVDAYDCDCDEAMEGSVIELTWDSSRRIR